MPPPPYEWDRVLDEARAIAPGDMGQLLWIDARCQRAGMHPLDPWWVRAFRGFYASGKPTMVCRKALRAGGSSSGMRSLLRDTMFAARHLDPGTVGVVPIMSSSRDEATDRFFTARRILRACGVKPVKGDDDEMHEVASGGIGGEYRCASSLSGGGIIHLEDRYEHKLQMRILPAMRRAAVGYTGVAGFLDESDLWPNDPELHRNPAEVVISDVMKRFTTVQSARLYLFSASYYAKSAHQQRVDMGDTDAQHIARLGTEGARLDAVARRRLAATIGSTDKRLLEDGDPSSPDIPAWVSNASVAPIERCYQLSDGKLSVMLALYGGRASENAAMHQHPDTLARVAFARERVEGWA